jgi:RNA polymerase sigma-70 factor, ECF subfamily
MRDSQEQAGKSEVQDRYLMRPLSRAELDRLTDEELMLRFQKDDMMAFDLLVLRYKDPLMNFIYRFIGNSDDAADILQETFLRLYRKKHLYETIARFSTWIYTIAGNLAKSELRKPHRRLGMPMYRKDDDNEEHEISFPDKGPLPDRTADSAVKSKLIQDALLKINPDFREAVIMRDIQDLEYEEIAAILDLPLGTVKSRINRGRTQLQDLLKEIHD